MMWDRLFNAHPRSVGESYGEHFGVAMSFSAHLALAALACAVHAVLPFLFEKTASKLVNGLHHRMVTHRDRRTADEPEAGEQAGA